MDTTELVQCQSLTAADFSETAFLVVSIDPDNSYRFIEVRGVVEEIVPDPTGAFYMQLNDRYSGSLTEPPADKADRIVLVVRPFAFSKL
jgi:hypothetical protein